MKIIFLNTWHSTLRDELRAYIKKHLHDTAVFCFQEAHEEDRAHYKDLFGDFIAHTTDRQQTDGSWFSNVTYVRKDIPVNEHGNLFTTYEVDEKLGIVGYVTLTLEGKELTVCNVHGFPQPGHKLDTDERLHQSQKILETFSHKGAVIIGGDFNLLPHTQSVGVFSNYGFKNLIEEYDIKTTRNKITFERFPQNIQYYADYAFTSPTIKVKDFVVPEEIVSDHQPLELTVALN